MRGPTDATGSQDTESLALRAGAGTPGACTSLWVRCETGVLRMVRRRLGRGLRTRVESGDVLQDVAVEVLRSVRRFDPRGPGAFRAWLAALVQNRLCKLARKHGRLAASVPEAEPTRPETPSPFTEPMTALERSEELELVGRARASLPDEHRRVLELRHDHELPFREIGRLMGRSEAAAGMLHRRALVNLTTRTLAMRGTSSGDEPLVTDDPDAAPVRLIAAPGRQSDVA